MLFHSPRFRAIDTNGNPIPGALLNAYTVGTTTRKDTYSDVDLTTIHTNPVEADSAGLFPAIYLSGDYKFVLTDSNGNVVPGWTQDDVITQLTTDDVNYGSQTLTAALGAIKVVTAYGATGDGVTDDTAAIGAAAAAAMGGTLYFPPGVYSVSEVSLSLTADLEFVLSLGATIKGQTGSTPVLSVDGSSSRYRFKMSGGIIDSSLKTYVAGAQSGTCLELINLDEFIIESAIFKGGSTYLATVGDSGITTVECWKGVISNCKFYGHPDSGIYLSGGSSSGASDDYGDISVVGNSFYHCALGVSIKRQLARVSVTGNTFNHVQYGVVTAEASALPPGRSVVVSGNTFKFVELRAVEFRGCTGCVASGNLISDIGRDLSNTAAAGRAFFLNGSTNCVIVGNTVKMNEWTDQSLNRFIASGDATLDAVNYTGGNHLISSNVVDGVYSGVSESSTNPSVYVNNIITNITGVAIASITAGSLFQYWDGTTSKTYVGSTLMQSTDATNVSLKGIKFLDSATAASSAAAFSADRYIAVKDSGGTTRYLPLSDATW